MGLIIRNSRAIVKVQEKNRKAERPPIFHNYKGSRSPEVSRVCG